MVAVNLETTRTSQWGWRAALVAVLGVIGLVIGGALDPARMWLGYLMALVFAFTISVGALILLMIGYAANAKWMAVVRRQTEILALPLPVLAVLAIPLRFGLGWLYPWAGAIELSPRDAELLEHRAAFANPLAFAIRTVLYFAIVIVAAELLRRWSVRRERGDLLAIDPEVALGRERRFASAMLPPVGLALSFAMIDWVMTLEPRWYSSMFPVYLFAGGFLAAIAGVTIQSARIESPSVTPNHFHALGRMMLAFTVFWAYAAFFQALLIQIANKPDEVTYYLARLAGPWRAVVYILVIGHFALPFLWLLPRARKFRPRAMSAVAWWLVAMHLVDIYWIVIPSRAGGFHPVDLAALAAVGGVCVAFAAWRQHGRAPLATRDPNFTRGVAYRSPT